MKKDRNYGVGFHVGEDLESIIQIMRSPLYIDNTSFFIQCPEHKLNELYELLQLHCNYDVYISVKGQEVTPGSIWLNCISGSLYEFLSNSFKEHAVGIPLVFEKADTVKRSNQLRDNGGIIVIPKELFDDNMPNREKAELIKLSNIIVKLENIQSVLVDISTDNSFVLPKKPKVKASLPIEPISEKGFASIIVNQDFTIEDTTSNLEQYFRNADNICGKSIHELTPIFSNIIWESIRHCMFTIFEDRTGIKKEFIDSDSTYLIDINYLDSSNNNKIRALITFTDITLKTKLTQNLERSETKFRLLFEKAPIGKSMMHPDGKYLSVNDAFSHMLGYKKDELVNISYKEITHPDDILSSEISKQKLLTGEEKEDRFQKRYLGKDGNIIWADISTRLFYTSDNKPLFFLTHIVDISKRIEAEKAKEIQNAKTLAMFDAINELMYVSDPDTYEIVYSNETFNTMLGIKTTPIGQKCYEVIQGLKEPCSFCTNNIIFKEKPEETHVWEFQNKVNGHWYRCADKAIDWIDGRKLRMELAIDITKEVEYRKNLEFSRERYTLATAASNNGIWDWHTDSEEVYYSDQWKAQIGYKPEELENTFSTWENNLHPDDKQRMIRSVMDFLENPKEYFVEEFRMIHKDGSNRWIHNRAAPVLDENGNVIRMFGAHSDITDLKKAEEELRKTDLMYRGIIENAPDGVVMLNFENNFAFVSNSALRMFEYNRDFILNADPSQLTHPDDLPKVLELLQNLTKSNPDTAPTLEYRFKHSNGSWRWIESTFSISNDEDGNPSIVINFRDIQQRKEYEQQLVDAKRKAESANIHKNYFLANMSHEIRTPMNGVIGFSELLKDDSITNEQKDKYLEIIDSNAKQLLSLIDDIIDVAKIESNELKIHAESCNLIDLMNDVLSTFIEIKKQKNKDNIELKLNIPNKLSQFSLKVDCNRLVQVFYNLIGNAIKFSDNGIIEFGFNIMDNKVNFYVKDQGIGIPEDKLEEIFDRFKQLNYEKVAEYGGTGLGLSICRGIVNLFGGELSVNSTLGKGTEFQFYIPYDSKEAQIIEKNTNDIDKFEFSSLNITILLVEDDPIVGLYFQEIFKSTNARLLWAKNGKEAISMYKQNDDISLVLMDIRMPEMNGYKATKEILRFDPKAKIVVQTAYAMQEEKEKCFAAGCIDYLTKPIVKSELENRLSHWLN